MLDRADLRTDLPDGRRELRLEVGPYQVGVAEVPGPSLSASEWRDVQLARLSYPAMWGWRCTSFEDDPFDGRGDHAHLYDVRHYLAWVREGESGAKLVTARKVALRPAALTPAQRAKPDHLLPLDLRFWKVIRPDGDSPLWESIRSSLCEFAPDDENAEFRVASLGRVATFPIGLRQASARQRERTAVAFAAIQLLAAHEESNLLYLWSLCAEFQDRVLAVRDVDGRSVSPAFVRTEETLGLAPGSVRLDNDQPVVREHKIAAPGYFVDNAAAAAVLESLLDEGSVTVADLRPSIGRLIEGESALGGAGRQLEELVTLIVSPGHRWLAETLTRPRLFKYAVPLLSGADPLTRMSLADLRWRLLLETGDGPFSAAVRPARWVEDARSILQAVEGKYPRRSR